jgi:hypothetical protein
MYKCVCEVLAWLARKSMLVNVENIMGVVVKTQNRKQTVFVIFESILREITKGLLVYNGS